MRDLSMKRPVISAVGLCGQSVFLSADHFHEKGETIHAEKLCREPGGKAYNQAVAARRLGADVMFVGCVGDDADGRECRQFLLEEGIEPILETADCPTAYAGILTDRTGENRVTVFAGASAHLSERFLWENEARLRRSDVMLLGLECPIEATLAACEIARRNLIPVILNPAPAGPLPDRLLAGSWLITPNRQEAAALFGLPGGASASQIAERLRTLGFSRAVVTLGGDGAVLIDGPEACHFRALPVRAVDTTGAGDSFNAALAVKTAAGWSLRKAVEYAVNASAYSVQRPHVMGSLPTARALEAEYRPCDPVRIDP